MHKKKIALSAISFLFIFSCLSGCGSEPVEVKEPEIIVVETEKAEPEEVEEQAPASLIIEERESVDGKIQSYLTGEWTDEEIALRRPIAVMIPNNRPAMPQYGISQAGIIYEAPVEGRITRLMAVFENFDDLERIGPIRSSRDYFVYMATGYEAIYCNWGLAVPYVEELINRDTVYNISAAVVGIHNPADEAFDRVSRPGYATEFTGYLMIDGLMKAVDRLGYDWNYDENYVRPFLFAADGVTAEYAENEDAVLIYPGGESGNNSGGYGTYHPYFEYHEDDHLYYRYQDGKEQIDEYNNEQIAVSNVIFQYCHGEVRDDHDYLAFGVHGDGDAIVFTNGKVIKGTWERYDGDFTPAKYVDENGEEIVMNQGKTWICNIWDDYGEFVEWK
ncbi:MAG: DUF3048 domain-containing protein [Bacillus sp. (in: Bacteria)]|nr:DUF3048 domain-containing protein [Bacillus sp. (in: firmicutes)]MCM1425061.1 DUF3048 domain-containing protein [Eubacterium sp.]